MRIFFSAFAGFLIGVISYKVCFVCKMDTSTKTTSTTSRKALITASKPHPKPNNIKSSAEWPACEPIDKTDKFWKFNNNLNCNGVNYLKAEVNPGQWQWVENTTATLKMAQAEDHRRKLYQALRTRPLTDRELEEALGYGNRLNIDCNVNYFEEQKSRELNESFLQQHKLRLVGKP